MKVLKVLSSIASGSFERSLRCEACGEEFKCGASLRGCWCSEITLDERARNELRSSYADCLCRNCLEKAQRECGH